MLQDVFGERAITALKDAEMGDYFDLFREFETKKRYFSSKKKEKVTFRISGTLRESFEKYETGTLEEKLFRVPYGRGLELRASDKLRVDPKIIQNWFDDPLDLLIQTVRKILRKRNMRKVNKILLVGGFGESPYTQERMTLAFQNKTIVIPKDASIAVLKGAVRYGHDPGLVSSGSNNIASGQRTPASGPPTWVSGPRNPASGPRNPPSGLRNPALGLRDSVSGRRDLASSLQNQGSNPQNPASGPRNPALGLSDPASGLRDPASGLSDPASSLRDPASGLREPASGRRDPALGLRHPGLGLRDPASGLHVHDPATGLRDTASGLRDPTDLRNSVSGRRDPASSRRYPALELRDAASGRRDPALNLRYHEYAEGQQNIPASAGLRNPDNMYMHLDQAPSDNTAFWVGLIGTGLFVAYKLLTWRHRTES